MISVRSQWGRYNLPRSISTQQIKQGQTKTSRFCDLDSIAFIQTLATHQPWARSKSRHTVTLPGQERGDAKQMGCASRCRQREKSADFCPQRNRSRHRNGRYEPLETSFNVLETSLKLPIQHKELDTTSLVGFHWKALRAPKLGIN